MRTIAPDAADRDQVLKANLVEYALEFLRSQMTASLRTEIQQEIAPWTQDSGEPLPEIRPLMDQILAEIRGDKNKKSA